MNKQRLQHYTTHPADPSLLEAELARLRRLVSDLSPSLAEYLKHRGFVLHKERSNQRYVLQPDKLYYDEYFRMLDHYSFRLFLRDLIGNGPDVPLRRVTKFISAPVYADYVERAQRWGLISRRSEVMGGSVGN